MKISKLSESLPGKVLADEETLNEFQTDFGHIALKRPAAVVVPGSTADVQQVVRFALNEGTHVATRGSAHSQSGQSLSDGGIVLDMSGLNKIGRVENNTVWAEAGVLWRDLAERTYSQGLLPRVLTNNLGVTVGGTLSMAGLGVASHRYGTQADNVTELEVVTGEGHLVRCSSQDNRELFDCCRCGLGQFGIITGARIQLRPVAERARTYYLLYDDLGVLMRDQEKLIAEETVDYIESWCSPCPQGLRTVGDLRLPFAEWFYPMQITIEAEEDPRDEMVLDGLKHFRKVHVEDASVFDFANRLEPLFESWKMTGAWNLPHPWMEVVLPWSTANAYIQGILADFPPNLLIGGHILLWPCKGTTSIAPLFRHPGGEFVMGFGILPAVPRHFLQLALPVLKKASDLCSQVGGHRYLSGHVEYSQEQWKQHFGELWPKMLTWKQFYDPRGILNPGFIPFPKV